MMTGGHSNIHHGDHVQTASDSNSISKHPSNKELFKYTINRGPKKIIDPWA